jgi:CBS domain-containing protein
MKFVADLLANKGRDVWSVPPTATVYEALGVMADKNIGALLVLNGDELAGIISERDYARRVALQGRRSRDTPVGDIMTRVVATVSESHSVQDCMELMTRERVRHLPVIQHGRLAGVISIGDVVFSMISEQKDLINQLESYIQGKV